jgi:hypothetical protein
MKKQPKPVSSTFLREDFYTFRIFAKIYQVLACKNARYSNLKKKTMDNHQKKKDRMLFQA